MSDAIARIALGIEYAGAGYHGWQHQQGLKSIQSELTKALSFVANHPVELVCAGRTDAGVHACGQVVHFDHQQPRELKSWILGANSRLPDSISVSWAQQVSFDFHARFSATARRYRYIINNTKARPALFSGLQTWYYHPLDAEAMHAAAQCLVGEQDFSSFRARDCQSNSPYRHLQHIRVKRYGDLVVIDVQANAFLHHMVRNITGSLLAIGRGKYPVDWLADVLAAQDRRQADVTAPADGLYLIHVTYPHSLALPQRPLGPSWLANFVLD